MHKYTINAVVLTALIFLPACSATQSRFSFIGQEYVALSDDAPIEVLTEPPQRPFVKVSRLDVHLEKTHFIGSSLKNALPLLKEQARHSGANAIMDIKERNSTVGETRIYHVTAIGIKIE